MDAAVGVLTSGHCQRHARAIANTLDAATGTDASSSARPFTQHAANCPPALVDLRAADLAG